MNRVVRTIGLTFGVAALVVGLQLVLSAGPAQAGILTSSDFTFGFGATVSGSNAWTTTENDSNNSPTTQGSFTFLPVMAGSSNSATGPTFPSPRVLTAGSSIDVCGNLEDPGMALTITASYNGAPIPGGSNYRLKLEIASLGIYAGDMPGTHVGQARWDETTSGHSQSSGEVLLPITWSMTAVESYAHVTWNPGNYEVPLTGLNDSFTRTFVIPNEGLGYRFADGAEVLGRVSLVCDTVPEPSSVALLASALMGLMAYAWRRQK